MRKKLTIIFFLIISFLLAEFYITKKYYDPKQSTQIAKQESKLIEQNDILKNGDIIFQTSRSRQSKAIQLATNSKYSHCGIIFQIDSGKSKWYVLEAVGPVKFTPLEIWISRGNAGHYVLKRNDTNPPLSDETLTKLKSIAEKYIGKDYDLAFSWTNDKIYCSELVWKCYKELTGLDFGKLQHLSDFNLSDELVKLNLTERYGGHIPCNEIVISPASIFNSDLLKTVKENQ